MGKGKMSNGGEKVMIDKIFYVTSFNEIKLLNFTETPYLSGSLDSLP